MKQSKPFIAVLCVLLLTTPAMYSQGLDNSRGPDFSNEGTHWYSGFVHNYEARSVRPIDISNSGRIDSLIRAGNLYLSLSDAISLALENNIDIEVCEVRLSSVAGRAVERSRRIWRTELRSGVDQHRQLGTQRANRNQLHHVRWRSGQYWRYAHPERRNHAGILKRR